MRVSQIQNITWAGNVLVLGGVVWVGLQFWQVKHAKPAGEPAWAQAKTEDVGKQRWPGERSVFDDIHKTHISGKVPPPPPPPEKAKPVDRTTEFKSKLKYVSGVMYPTTPEMSLAQVSYDGKVMWIQPGDEVSGFRLIEFTRVPAKQPEAAPGKPSVKDQSMLARMVFRNPDDDSKPVVIEQPDPQFKPLAEPGKGLVETPEDTEGIKRGRCPKNGPLRTGFQDPQGNWIITEDEQLWIELWGEELLLPNLGTKPETDGAGNPCGVRITSLPEPKTPLAPSHGIAASDVIRSINGVAVNSKEEIVEYFRGPGKGLSRYEILVVLNGAERTVVYRLPRRVKASRD